MSTSSSEVSGNSSAGTPGVPAVTGRGPRLVGYEYGLPDEYWAGWSPQHHADDLAETISHRLSDGPAAQGVVRSSVLRLNSDALSKGSLVVRQGVWVPDRSTGRVVAVLDTMLVAARRGALTPERHLSRSLRREFGWTTQILEQWADVTDVPAGRTTVRSVVLRRRGDPTVQYYLFLDVFPPTAVEGFSFVLNTVHLDLAEAIARQGRVMANSLKLTLGDIAGERRIE